MAEGHQVGVLAVARALVSFVDPHISQRGNDAALLAATAACGHLFSVETPCIDQSRGGCFFSRRHGRLGDV